MSQPHRQLKVNLSHYVHQAVSIALVLVAPSHPPSWDHDYSYSFYPKILMNWGCFPIQTNSLPTASSPSSPIASSYCGTREIHRTSTGSRVDSSQVASSYSSHTGQWSRRFNWGITEMQKCSPFCWERPCGELPSTWDSAVPQFEGPSKQFRVSSKWITQQQQ